MSTRTLLVCLSILAFVLVMSVTGCGKKGGEEAAGGAGGPEAAGGMAGPAGPGAGGPPAGGPAGPGAGGPPAGGPAGPGGPGMGGPGGPGGPGAGGPPGGGPGMGGPGGPGMGGPGAGGPGGPGAGGPGGPDAGGPGGGPAGEEPKKIEKPKMDPAEVSAKLAEAMQAKKAGDIDGALKLTTDVLRAHPENVEANWIAAWLLADKDDTALAIGQFERVMKLGLDGGKAKQAAAALKRLKARQG